MAIERLGPYRLDKILGRGGMGTVYAARNVETGEQAAVKLLSTSIAQEEHFRQRFEAEIQSLIKLDHPNIVRIFAYDIESEHMYYSMELVDGRSLFDEQKSGRRFNWREVAQIGIETCAALRNAHDRGVLHRDLKPGNLMLTSQGQIKLTDFGIAKLFGGRQLTADGSAIGTVDFMSPEQAKGEPTSPRSDLYSLGSVMFSLLARRPPFAAKTIPATLHSLSVDAPPPVRDFAPETPVEMEKLIDKLLSKDPAKRVGSAQSVANRLQMILEDVQEEDVNSEDQEFDLAKDNDPNLTSDSAASRSEKPTITPPSIGHLAMANEAQSTRRSPTLVDKKRNKSKHETTDRLKGGFTEVDDEVRKREDDLGKHTDQRQPVWPLALGLVFVVALVAFGVVYANKPPSADRLYETIQEAAKDDDEDRVLVVANECRDFLDRYPADSRAEEIRQTLDRIELLRYPRRLERKRQMHGLASLSPAELIFVRGLENSDRNPERASADFQALVDLFAGDPDEVECVDAARKQLSRLQKTIETTRLKHIDVLQQRIDSARKVMGDPNSSPVVKSSAEKMLRAIIQLYVDKPWASKQVEEAKELLEAAQP